MDNIKHIIDSHVHVLDGGIEGVHDLLRLQDEFGYIASNFLSCECMGDAAQNALGIYLKLIAPNNYAYGGFHYRYSYSFADEAKKLMNIGFDGMKMVENKPTLRKELNMASNDSRYDEFYRWMEDENIPMIIHVADPEDFWDEDIIPEWAKEIGYFYGDGTFITKETIYEEIIDVLTRYPKLPITFAHFFFMSADIERLSRLMDTYPMMCLDVVSGTEMYFNFTKNTKAIREFFIKYQDRIIYGTDNVNMNNPIDIENACIINKFQREFISKDHDIPAWDKTIKGIALPKEVQDKIFRKNYLRLAGNEPKKLNIPAAIEYLENRLNDHRLRLTDDERNIIIYVNRLCKDRL